MTIVIRIGEEPIKCQWCYGKGFTTVYRPGIGKALGPSHQIKCKHCGGRRSDDHALAARYGIEEDI